MSIFIDVIILLVLLFALVKSAQTIQQALVIISNKLRISTFISGFLFLSMASSLPEISLAINASLHEIPELSIGNLFGATVFLLTVCIGVLVLRRGNLKFGGHFGTNEVFIAGLLILMQISVVSDRRLTFVEGVTLMVLFICFALYMLFKAQKAKHIEDDLNVSSNRLLISLGQVVLGMAVLLISSSLVVDYSLSLASGLNISEVFIGLFILGIGTNLPELILLLTSKPDQSDKLALGNIVGSATTNVFTLGLLGTFIPHNINDASLLIPVGVVLTISVALFCVFAFSDKEITRREGIILLSMFGVLIAYQIVNNFLPAIL